MTADPSLLRTAPEDRPVRVTVTAPLVHRCPHVPEVDAGSAELSWVCDGATVELHSLAAYLATWAPLPVSHEEITDQLVRDLGALDGLELVRVVTYWTTAGLSVAITSVGP